MKISQSMMKAYTDYVLSLKKFREENKTDGKSCGLLFKANYIDKSVSSIPSDSMKEGIYFEYLCTGALDRNGAVPEPEKTKSGSLTAGYERVTKASQLFKKIIEHYDIKILEKGYVVSTDECTGIIDIFAEWNGKKCIIDLKYSGLIDDKWSDLGWDEESLPLKDSLMIQGVHYKLLVKDVLGIDVPFYYFIFNSKDPNDMKIIEEIVDEERFESHKEMVQKVKLSIEQELKKGFTPLPNYRLCKKCPLFETCESRQEFPKVTEVYY